MSDLEPITRAENFWVNEGDLEPITRKEQYIKHLYDETQVVPEYPKTREEYFINKAGEELHDVTVEQLNVTENGTYSEAGKAYSPVIVEVPEPTLITKSITANGTYTASSDNADGYSSVDVHVSGYKISEVSGLPSPIATFSDGSALPMPKLKIAVEPVQSGSGDPSPTNIRPISGWDEVNVSVSGVNVWDEEWVIISNVLNSKNYIPVKPNTQYYMTPHQGRDYICFDSQFNVVKSWTWLSSLYPTFTTPSNCYYIKFRMTSDYGTTYNNDISINYPSTDTSYHAYNGQTYTTTLKDGQGNPMTCYGGTLTNENGVQSLDNGMNIVDLSTLNWSKYGDDRFYTSISDIKMPETLADRNKGMMCSIYKPSPYLSVGEMADYSYLKFNQSESFWVRDSRYSDATAFKTAMNGVKLVYELATPTTIQLTPTAVKSLLGTNNLWADTGDVVEASYFESL